MTYYSAPSHNSLNIPNFLNSEGVYIGPANWEGSFVPDRDSVLKITSLGRLRKVSGSVVLLDCPNLKSLGALEEVEMNLSLRGLPLLESLGKVDVVGSGFYCTELKSLEDLGCLTAVGGSCHFINCPKLRNLGSLEIVTDNLEIGGGTRVRYRVLNEVDSIRVQDPESAPRKSDKIPGGTPLVIGNEQKITVDLNNETLEVINNASVFDLAALKLKVNQVYHKVINQRLRGTV